MSDKRRSEGRGRFAEEYWRGRPRNPRRIELIPPDPPNIDEIVEELTTPERVARLKEELREKCPELLDRLNDRLRSESTDRSKTLT